MSYNTYKPQILLTTLAGILCLLSSCVDGPSEAMEKVDRQPLLENLADVTIIPGLENFNTRSQNLLQAINGFSASPNQTTLNTAREAFHQTYVAWQYVSFMEFGPAFSESLRGEVNSFPTDNFSIENNVASGNFSLTSFTTQNRRGLPALDYLLYGLGENDAAIIEKYTSDANATKRREYISTITTILAGKAETVYQGWLPQGGNFRQEFISKDGTDVGSSLGLMINSLSQYVERFTRDARVGIPLGKRSQGTPIPRNVEAYFSGKSVELAKHNVAGIRNYYLGRNATEDGLGFYEYLKGLNSGQENALADKLQSQLNLALEKVEAMPSPLSHAVQQNPSHVEQAHAELQKLVILIKTEFSSALGVLITYQDNDGD